MDIKDTTNEWMIKNDPKCLCGQSLRIIATDFKENSADIGCPGADQPGNHSFLTVEFQKQILKK